MLTTSPSLLGRLQQANDQEAWRRFVDLYGPVLLTWAGRLGLPSADAADLVQEVLTLLIVKVRQFEWRREGSFRAWLRTVTRNKWLELQRRRVPAPQGDGRNLPLPLEPDAAEQFWEKEYQDFLVGRALEVMQSDFQPATWQAAWEVLVVGRPAAEVGSQLGLTVGAVHAARFRVLARLRQEMFGLID